MSRVFLFPIVGHSPTGAIRTCLAIIKRVMNQASEKQKLTVPYEGKDYEATYSVSDDFVEVEILLAGVIVMKKAGRDGAGARVLRA